MGDVKEYIRGDKHVHQAGSVMIKIVQYNVPGQRQEGCCQQADEDAIVLFVNQVANLVIVIPVFEPKTDAVVILNDILPDIP